MEEKKPHVRVTEVSILEISFKTREVYQLRNMYSTKPTLPLEG